MTRDELKKLSVIVLAGGWSDEHEISLQSGEEVKKALKQAGFEKVELLDIALPGAIEKLVKGSYDVAFVAMHGHYGEDGCIQGLLEILHIPYTFSGVLASAMGTEKEVSKLIYKQAGIPVPKGIDISAGTKFTDEEIEQVVTDLGLPIFVKPAANGSSFGVTRVTSKDQLLQAIEDAGAQGDRVLIEECVAGTEITVPVIGNDHPTALPIVEIVFEDEFYSIEVKAEPASLHHITPARLAPDVYARAQELAICAHKALGCRGVSRSDFIVKADGTPVILETNMIPGMTERSLIPDSARTDGIPFSELCTRFIEYALEEHGKIQAQ